MYATRVPCDCHSGLEWLETLGEKGGRDWLFFGDGEGARP